MKLVHVSGPAELNQRGGTIVVATRSELGLLDWPDESALRIIATNGPPLIDRTTEALNAIVAALHAAARERVPACDHRLGASEPNSRSMR